MYQALKINYTYIQFNYIVLKFEGFGADKNIKAMLVIGNKVFYKMLP